MGGRMIGRVYPSKSKSKSPLCDSEQNDYQQLVVDHPSDNKIKPVR